MGTPSPLNVGIGGPDDPDEHPEIERETATAERANHRVSDCMESEIQNEEQSGRLHQPDRMQKVRLVTMTGRQTAKPPVVIGSKGPITTGAPLEPRIHS